jgi:hypothetical protein
MDTLQMYGQVQVIKKDLKGNVIFQETFKNKITNFACQQMANLLCGVNVPVPSQISVGTGTGTPAATDTALFSEISGSKKALSYSSTWLLNYAQMAVDYDQTQILGVYNASTNPNQSITLTEAGLWDVNNNLFAHVNLGAGVTHDNTSTLSVIWQILIQGV